MISAAFFFRAWLMAGAFATGVLIGVGFSIVRGALAPPSIRHCYPDSTDEICRKVLASPAASAPGAHVQRPPLEIKWKEQASF